MKNNFTTQVAQLRTCTTGRHDAGAPTLLTTLRSALLITLLTTLLGLSMLTPSSARADELLNTYFSGKNPVLSKDERAALAAANKRNQEGTVPPFTNAQGAVSFVFGTQIPSIVCAVLQVCDVALQPGEQVNSIHLGDAARWSVEPAITGSGPMEVQHLIIKPRDVGLETSLVVTTNRRTYHMRLRSHRTDYMPQVAFTYPEETQAKWEAIQKRETQQREKATLPETGEYLADLSFNYELEGKAAWKPVRVYNDGRKTMIEMPRVMEQTEAPTLLLIQKDGGLLTEEETVMVNYRVQGARYIVDSVFDKAILIAGVGKAQDRITITRRK